MFADVDVDDADHVVRNWEEIKREEKGRTSVFAGIPSALPSLAYAEKVQRKAPRSGSTGPTSTVRSPRSPRRLARSGARRSTTRRRGRRGDEVGDLLFAVVNVARHLGVDAEIALRAATAKFRSRFEQVEQLAAEEA